MSLGGFTLFIFHACIMGQELEKVCKWTLLDFSLSFNVDVAILGVLRYSNGYVCF